MGASEYVLAVDIGTSRIAAATARISPRGSIEAAPFALGRKGDSVASVVFVTEDGGLLFGDAAERRGLAQPERLVREFKRTIGDSVPVTVGGRTLQAEELYAQTFASVVDAVAEREGGLPEAVSLTHPTVWGGHRLGLVRAALSRAGIRNVVLISEPEAAARHYEATRPLEPGQALAVYDLGGGTFDAVVLRKGEASSFEIVGDPAGIDDLGGADFDDAVFRHVITTAGIDPAASDVDDPDLRIALAQLRREAVDAKEALSFDSDATVPVLIPPSRSSVRITRSEFEAMIEGALDRTIDTLEDAIESAALTPDRLEAILLIGGSSRIPLVAQRLSETFDRPLAVDADPKAAIALGAARTALIRVHDETLGTGAAVPLGTGTALAHIGGTAPAGTELELARTGGELAPRPTPTPRSARRGSPLLMAGASVVIAGAIVFGSTVAAGSRSDEVAETGVQTTQSPRPTPTPTPTPTGAGPVAPDAPPGSAVFEQPQSQTAPDSRRAGAVRAAPAPRTPKATQSSPLPSGGSGSAMSTDAADSATPDQTAESPVATSEPPAPDPTPAPTTTAPPATEPPAPDPTPDPPATEPPATEPPAPEPTAPPPVMETPTPGPV